LLEHYQGEMGSGAIYLKSPTAEGAIFFEATNSWEALLKTVVKNSPVRRRLNVS